MCPQSLVVVGSMILMRELEIAFAKLPHVVFNHSAVKVSLWLPTSKTDPTAVGTIRTWECLCCIGVCNPCPHHELCLHVTFLKRAFPDPDMDVPLFPNH